MPTHKHFPQTAPIVRTRFMTNHNSVGLARKKGQTILFVEYGFERLGLGHQAVGFSWYPYMVKSSSPLESFSWRRAGRFWFLAIFSQPLLWIAYFSFYTSLYFFIIRPRVGLTFQDWYLSHQPILKVVGGGCKSWRVWLCQVQNIEWQ